jgi:FlaA1/EpsC-like NDP-sugar epimerase
MTLDASPDAVAPVAQGRCFYRLTLLPRPDVAARGGANWPDVYRRLALSGDAAAAVVSCLAAQVAFVGLGRTIGYAVVTALLPAVWICLLAAARAYTTQVLCSGRDEWRRVTGVGVLLVALAATTSYLVGAHLSRGYVVVGAAGAVAGSYLVRLWLRGRLHRSRRAGRNLRRALVVGHADRAARAIEALDASLETGVVAVGACLPSDGRRVTPASGIPLTADVEPVLAQVDELGVDAVVLVTDLDLAGLATRRLAEGLAARSVDLLVWTATDCASWLPNAQPVPSPAALPLITSIRTSRAGSRS